MSPRRRSLFPALGLLFLAGLGGSLLWLWSALAPRNHPPGILIPESPHFQQLTESQPSSPYRRQAVVKLRGRVLGHRRYLDRWADHSPIDVVFGWQELSDSAVLKTVFLSQEGRKYRLRSSNLPDEMLYGKSGNFSLIPDNPEVADFLTDLRIGDLVELEGSLVDIPSEELDTEWVSTRSLAENGPEARYLLWVTRIRTLSNTSTPTGSTAAAFPNDPEKPAPANGSPPGSSENLKEWYQRLMEAQKRLDPKDAEAVKRFNEEARHYMEAAHPRRTPSPAPQKTE